MRTAPLEQRAHRHWQAGVGQARNGLWKQAEHEFEQATRLAPAQGLYWLNLARARMRLGQLEGAAEAAQRSLRLDPSSAVAGRLAAESLQHLNRHDEALACLEAVDVSAERDHDFHAAHGNALFQVGRPAEAVPVFFKALALKMDSALVHYRLGLCFMDMHMHTEAIECFRTAALLSDEAIRALATPLLVHLSRQACQWERLEQDSQLLRELVAGLQQAHGHLLSPFALLPLDVSPQEQLTAGRLRSAALTVHVRPLPARPWTSRARIRLGYLSSDFYQHATAVLMAELLERHDRQRFEVYLYSHSRDDGSALRRRLELGCDRFCDVSQMSSEQVAKQVRDDAVDILVDLKGHTRGSRFEVLAWRPAPLQIAYLGYPGSTGATFVDYVVGDPVVTPLEHASHFSECIAQMPWSYQPNDRRRALPAAASRRSVGLPEDAVVLCCFNQAYKISPRMLDLWCEILRRRPETVLWLLKWNDSAERNLIAEFARRGIAQDRLVFAPKLNLGEHLSRLRCADIFLDTWPCNAHTTASEALWAGVPVLTVPGATFASRVAASLLRACRMPELACTDERDYVERAVSLCADRERLGQLQRALDEQRLTLPLFDTDRYARDFEALLLRMADRAAAGLPPAHLPAIPPSAN